GSGADGVHLGRIDVPIDEARELVGDAIVGLSAASPEELRRASASGADYVGSGPVFPTATKETGREPLGLGGVRELSCMRERPPIVAIGGIGVGSLREVFAAGAEFAAVVSAVCAADGPRAALGDLVTMMATGLAAGAGGAGVLDEQVNYEGLRHCPRCAGGLRARRVRDSVRLRCAACGYVLYLPPAPVTCTIIERGGEVLLVRRRYPPGEGAWCLPAGFVEPGEDPAGSAAREVREETGLDIEITGVFDTWASREDPRTPVVSIAFTGRVVGGRLRPGDDASEARYFPLDSLPDDIAFRTHRDALARYARGR
ncbi:MAG: NUDIX domain-containing protein, partial [Candidatus Eisenbacteria bacterium]|nr:NUDIX domain-containing protein [Candidatus Eisenbacteria bacterium]